MTIRTIDDRLTKTREADEMWPTAEQRERGRPMEKMGEARSANNSYDPTARTTLKRRPQRGAYDRPTVHAILDAAFVCHVGFVVDGQPFVIPTSYGRDGDLLYIHGAAASRMLRELATGIPVAVTVTLIDGLVLARSAFHHSLNYRSVVVLGTGVLVEDPAEKMRALEVITEQIIAGRWAEARRPTESELKATTVIRLPLVEVSAKIRTGPPIDDEEDQRLPIWAGILPLAVTPGEPISDPLLHPEIPLPDSVTGYKIGKGECA
jgi:nitroimidazol reductase NimA-like FMN-containing flavoprotein (pyridoxamine 5'-phosphate oxidase superfamily)